MIISRNRHWAIRPDNYGVYAGNVWLVEKGQEYDLVQFVLRGMGRTFYGSQLCVPCDWTDRVVKKVVKQYVKHLKRQDIEDYKSFLKRIAKWGCE